MKKQKKSRKRAEKSKSYDRANESRKRADARSSRWGESKAARNELATGSQMVLSSNLIYNDLGYTIWWSILLIFEFDPKGASGLYGTVVAFSIYIQTSVRYSIMAIKCR